MLLRRHRDRLEEFTRPEAGAPDYKRGKLGAAKDEPGGPSSESAPKKSTTGSTRKKATASSKES